MSTTSVYYYVLNHLANDAWSFLPKILKKWRLGNCENSAMVTLPHSDHVTTKHFRVKILYFKRKKSPNLALYLFYNMKWATWALDQLFLVLKYCWNIPHGYMYAIRIAQFGNSSWYLWRSLLKLFFELEIWNFLII